MQEDKNKIYIATLVIFWIILAFFIITMAGMYLQNMIPYIGYVIGISLWAILPILGIVLIILAVKAGFTKIAKAFFILTGASALGIGVSILLHNLLYGLLIKIFGEGIWSKLGDEPVFFILATIVCPLGLLAGAIGSIVLIVREKVKA